MSKVGNNPSLYTARKLGKMVVIYILTVHNMITVTHFLITSHVDGYFSLATRAGGRHVFQSSLIERESNEYD